GWRFPALRFWFAGRAIGWKNCSATSTRPMPWNRCSIRAGVGDEDERKPLPVCRLRRYLDHPHRLPLDDCFKVFAAQAGDRGIEEEIGVETRLAASHANPALQRGREETRQAASLHYVVLSLRPVFLATIWAGFGFSLCGPLCLPGLTAYLLDVKVFVWFNPSILVTGTHPLSKGVERQRCLCAILVLTPRNWEIGGAS